MAYYPLQLRQARAARRWSLEDAATASGLSAGTIARWERQDDARPVSARTQTLNKYISLYELAHSVAGRKAAADEAYTRSRPALPCGPSSIVRLSGITIEEARASADNVRRPVTFDGTK